MEVELAERVAGRFLQGPVGRGPGSVGSWPCTCLREQHSREREQHVQRLRGRNKLSVFEKPWAEHRGWSRTGQPVREIGREQAGTGSRWDLHQRRGVRV